MPFYELTKEAWLVKHRAAPFLNGLTSNSLEQPRNAFLTIHGRIIATFDQVRAGEDEFLLVMERPYVGDVLKHLERYALLNKTVLEKTDFRVYFDLNGDYRPQAGEYTIAQKKGQLVVTRQQKAADITEEQFTLFRVRHNIPVHGIDYKDEFILNVSEPEFVSFTKGCFLGQEPVAKVHNRSKPTWKLVVRQEDGLTPQERPRLTSRVMDPDTGKMKGFFFIKNTE